MKKASILKVLRKAYFSESPDEQSVLKIFPFLLNNASLFVDIGASLGQFTKSANECLKNAEIVSIEADTVRFEELSLNCERWEATTGNNIEPIHAAVTNKSGPVQFYITNSPTSGGLFQHSTKSEFHNKIKWSTVNVEGFALDEMFIHQAPDFIKMDIEGSEILALQGAEKMLEEGETTWLIELHGSSPNGQNPITVVPELMKRHGYSRHVLYGKNLFTKDKAKYEKFLPKNDKSVAWL